jgi:hypothetical protein
MLAKSQRAYTRAMAVNILTDQCSVWGGGRSLGWIWKWLLVTDWSWGLMCEHSHTNEPKEDYRFRFGKYWAEHHGYSWSLIPCSCDFWCESWLVDGVLALHCVQWQGTELFFSLLPRMPNCRASDTIIQRREGQHRPLLVADLILGENMERDEARFTQSISHIRQLLARILKNQSASDLQLKKKSRRSEIYTDQRQQ